MLYLDAGDLLFHDLTVSAAPQGDLFRARARLVARTLERGGVAAVNVGRKDLAAGLGFVGEVGRDPGLPWVATNLATRDGDHPFPRWRVVEWGTAKVGVVGVLPPEPKRDGELGLRVQDPAAAIGEVLPALKGVDAVVCLSNLGLDAERLLARRMPSLALIVGGMTNHFLSTPVVEGSTLILHVGDRGRYLGVLDIPRAALAAWSSPRYLQERTRLEGRLVALRAQIEAREAKSPDADPERTRSLRAEERSVIADLARFDQAPAVYDHRIEPLSAAIGEDPVVAGWVARLKASEARAAPRPAPRSAPAPVRPPRSAVPPRPPPTGALYQGTAACRSCHPAAYQTWIATGHARAYAAVGAQPPNPQCLACHTARLNRTAGPSVEPVVGCEACHGPGGNHRGRGNIVRRPPESVCRTCHRGFHPTETFDYRADLAKIRCDEPRPGSSLTAVKPPANSSPR